MASLFSSGLETEIDAFTTEWDGKDVDSANTLTVSSTAGHFNSGSKGAKVYHDGTAVDVYSYATFTSTAEVWARWYVKLPTGFTFQSDYDAPILFSLYDGATYLAQVKIRADVGAATFHLQMRTRNTGGTTTAYQGGTDEFTLNTWHYIEVHFKAGSGSDGGYELKLDGAVLDTDFTQDCSTYEADTIHAGTRGAQVTATDEYYFDDVEVDDAAYPGAVTSGSVDVEQDPVGAIVATGYNPVVTVATGEWEMGPYIHSTTGGTHVIQSPAGGVAIQGYDHVVSGPSVPTNVEQDPAGWVYATGYNHLVTATSTLGAPGNLMTFYLRRILRRRKA